MHESVQHRVTGRIISLPGRSQNACNRRKHDKEVKGLVTEDLVQVPGTLNLGTRRTLELFKGHVGDRTVGQYTRCVNHTMEGRVRIKDPRNSRLQRSGVGYVGLASEDLHTTPLELGELFHRLVGRSSARQQGN